MKYEKRRSRSESWTRMVISLFYLIERNTNVHHTRLLQEEKAQTVLSKGIGKTRQTAMNVGGRGLPPACGKRG